MAAIKKTSGIAFSEEIFLSILICLVAKNKHLVLHTSTEVLPELKSVVEQVRHRLKMDGGGSPYDGNELKHC